MLIHCPSCASQYELDPAKLGPVGRKVRCAHCGALWHVEAAPDFPEAPSADETRALLDEELSRAAAIDGQVSAMTAEQAAPPPTQPGKPAENGRKRRGGRRNAGADGPKPPRFAGASPPLVLAVAGAALLGLLVWQRDRAARVAPQLAAVFQALRLPVNVVGLNLSGVESGLLQDGQGRVLVVEGDVTNITRSIAQVPPIEVRIRDASGQTLYTWTTDPPRPSLEPAELMHFRVRLASPPEAGQSVEVRFGQKAAAGLAKAP